MKKTRIAGLMMLAPLALLTACGGAIQSLTLSANWYAARGLPDQYILNTYERLEYQISTVYDGSVSYSGTYVTELKDAQLTLQGGSTIRGYVYTAESEITVTLDGESYTDTVTSTVEFLPAGKDLRPIRSQKTVNGHSPVSENTGLSMEKCDYTYTVEYSDDLSEATAVLKKDGESAITTEYKNLTRGGLFLDNEQILFALRGITFTASFTLRTINTARPQENKSAVLNVSAPTAIQDKFSFDAGGVQLTAESAAMIYILFNDDNSGVPQTLYYAQAPATGPNTFRNVLLRAEVTAPYGINTMRYDLVKVTFADK